MSAPESAAAGELAPPAYRERRTYVRLSCDLDATCRATGSTREVGWPAKVRDISLGGLGLVLKHCFPPGTDLAVELRDVAETFQRIVRVRVMHATAAHIDGNSCWLLGCAFDAPLTAEEFQALR